MEHQNPASRKNSDTHSPFAQEQPQSVSARMRNFGENLLLLFDGLRAVRILWNESPTR